MKSVWLVVLITQQITSNPIDNVLKTKNRLLETSDDIDMWKDTPSLIISRRFKVETHTVVTEDDYILTMFRIVNPKNRNKRKQPVYLQHGALATSDVFLVNSKGLLLKNGVYVEDGGRVNRCNMKLNRTGNVQTLGFVLAACGYDVWLGNFRGNTYSSQHLDLKITDPEYWNVTVTDLALYDLTAMIDYIIETTKYDKISCIAHSAGGIAMIMLLALQPEIADKLNVFIALSPTAYGLNFDAFYQLSYLITQNLGFLNIPGGLGSIPNVKFNKLIDLLCNPTIGNQLCQMLTQSNLNTLKFSQTEARVKSCLVKIIDRFPFKPFVHSAQMNLAHRYQQFDYGCAGNRIEYGQCQVPAIPIQDIRLEKIAVFYGQGDQIAGPEDVRMLMEQLTVPIWRKFRAPDDWGHYDYILNQDAGRWSVPAILRFLREARND